MNQIASQAAEQAMGYFGTGYESAFPFLELPWELRHWILQYTDLTTTFRDLYWGLHSRYYVAHAMDYQWNIDSEDHHGFLF